MCGQTPLWKKGKWKLVNGKKGESFVPKKLAKKERNLGSEKNLFAQRKVWKKIFGKWVKGIS